MELLEVEHLTLTRRRSRRGWLRPAVEEETLIEDLSFTLERRKSLALVGDSREALFALGLAILKQGPVSSGKILFGGIPVLSFSEQRFRPVRKRIQAVFSDATGQLTPAITVRESFREVLGVWYRKATREERDGVVEAIMIACGLPEALQDLYPVELDAVERQQVALARALLPRPDMLVCDNFTAGLDVVQQAELINLLRRVREEFRLTLLVLTDDLAVAHHLGDDIAVLHRGRLVEMGPAGEVAYRPTHDHTRRLVACAA